ncbi:MAG: hypothetical protein LBK04_03115 [Clostridiales Family XIII bacterium]|jgi:predicted transcriptional regulator|nr:hypothetical protein [Clostridiales Family XIII bacterium]
MPDIKSIITRWIDAWKHHIAKRMDISASQASHYKKRLIVQGVIAERGRGLVEFAMPMLKEVLSETLGQDTRTDT